MRPVASRASRSAQRLASVAVSVNDQSGRPNRRLRSAPDPLGVRRREHRRQPALVPHPADDGVDGGAWAVAGHGAGVAEGEVDVLVSVDVHEPVAVRPVQVEREATAPLVHPGHGDPAEEVSGLLEQGAGRRVRLRVRGALPLDERGQLGAVDGAHDGHASGVCRAWREASPLTPPPDRPSGRRRSRVAGAPTPPATPRPGTTRPRRRARGRAGGRFRWRRSSPAVGARRGPSRPPP